MRYPISRTQATMSSTGSPSSDPVAGYLAEFDFVREGMRRHQAERHGFLGFALAANGLVLGLLMGGDFAYTASTACFLLCLGLGATLIAERMTIHASLGIASAAAYIRLFIEPNVKGLEFQGRKPGHIKRIGNVGSASRAFGLAYVVLTAAAALAWPTAPVSDGRELWQTGLVAVTASVSVGQVAQLLSPRLRRISTLERGWHVIRDAEGAFGTDQPRVGRGAGG